MYIPILHEAPDGGIIKDVCMYVFESWGVTDWSVRVFGDYISILFNKQ